VVVNKIDSLPSDFKVARLQAWCKRRVEERLEEVAKEMGLKEQEVVSLGPIISLEIQCVPDQF
jgi:hypothetical protein